MINNKVVTIKKENQFDKEWTLFTPCSLPRNINKSYSYMPTNDIIPIISKADEVHLILGRAGLPSSILNELKWVNKYLLHALNLPPVIAQEVIRRYIILFVYSWLKDNHGYNSISEFDRILASPLDCKELINLSVKEEKDYFAFLLILAQKKNRNVKGGMSVCCGYFKNTSVCRFYILTCLDGNVKIVGRCLVSVLMHKSYSLATALNREALGKPPTKLQIIEVLVVCKIVVLELDMYLLLTHRRYLGIAVESYDSGKECIVEGHRVGLYCIENCLVFFV